MFIFLAAATWMSACASICRAYDSTSARSSVKLTADTYSHVFAPAHRDAAAAMEAALG